MARNVKSGYDIRNKGITSELANKMVVYASTEIHSSNQKALELLGLGANWFSEYVLQLSRRFNALKVWMSIKEHGVKRFGRMISKNIDQAHYLGQLIIEKEKLELIAPIGLDIVCFRYNPGNMSCEDLNSLNKEIKLQIEEQGIALLGYTSLQGKYCMRIAIANHRSIDDDFDILIESILKIAQEYLHYEAP